MEIMNLMGFRQGTIPFTYLGAPIFKGAPKKRYFLAIADKIKAKLANWKGSLLSMAGRIQLVKSVIQGMMVYTLLIYRWPEFLLRSLQMSIKNFIYNGDIQRKAAVSVRWEYMCRPIEEKGLGLRSLNEFNDTGLCKLAYDFLARKKMWCNLLRSRYYKHGRSIQYYKPSSLWGGIKYGIEMIGDDLRWIAGKNSKCSLWRDKWLGEEALLDTMEIPEELLFTENYELHQLMNGGDWNIPPIFRDTLPHIVAAIEETEIEEKDDLIWVPAASGKMTIKAAFIAYRDESNTEAWLKKLWSRYIPPKVSTFLWRCITKSQPISENFTRRRLRIPNVCLDCPSGTPETMEHLLCRCTAAASVWEWVSRVLDEDMLCFGSVEEMIKNFATANMKMEVNQLKLVVMASSLWIIWKRRNKMRFEAKIVSANACCNSIRMFVRRLSFLFNSLTNRSIWEERCLSFFAIPIIYRRSIRWRDIIWLKPPPRWFKVNTDGASRGQPGTSTCGGIFRMFRGFAMGGFVAPVGEGTSVYAEMMGVIYAIEIAERRGWFSLWIETDSTTVVSKVKNDSDDIPWQIKYRWKKCMQVLRNHDFIVSHIHREGNKPADALANMGFELDDITWWRTLPMEVSRLYERNLNNVGEIRLCM